MSKNKTPAPPLDIFQVGGVNEAQTDTDDVGVEGPVIVQQMVASDPGWLAVYRTEKSNELRYVPLACFALCLMPTPEGVLAEIRPMTVDYDGTVVDVEHIDGFVCMSPPGSDPKTAVAAAEAKRDAETSDRT